MAHGNRRWIVSHGIPMSRRDYGGKNRAFLSQKFPYPWRSGSPSNTCFPEPRGVNTPNDTSIQQQQRPFDGLWSGTTRVGRYQKKHSPTRTHPDHRASFNIFLHLQRSMASSLFSLRAWQSSRTTSFQVFFGLPMPWLTRKQNAVYLQKACLANQ